MSRAFISIVVSSLFLAVAAPTGNSVETASPAPQSIADFFRAADISDLEISPDGKYVAFMTTLGTGKVGIAMMHVDTGQVEPLVAAHDENVSFFYWKGSDRVVYGGDIRGNESPALRSISISKRRVTALAESYDPRTADRANWASVVSRLPHDDDHILVYGNKEIGSRSYGYWKLNVRTGKRWYMGEVQGHFRSSQSTEVGRTGTILARTRDEGARIIYEVRADEKSPFKRIAEFDGLEPDWEFVTIGGDDETLYVFTSDETDTRRLHTINLKTAEISAPLFNKPEGQLNSVILSRDRMRLYGVSYETDRRHYHWFDQDRAKLQAIIDKSLPQTFNVVVSASLDEKRLVILSSSDRDPGTYYLLDKINPRLMPIGRTNTRINPAAMRPMESIKFTARDGLVIHGYLTRPAGHENSAAPLVVLPHGGPFGPRDSWGYNAEVQFLASRGYAVLQVNFRGSGGYGSRFLAAGRLEWGGKMQDDLTDAVKWAIDTGAADPTRIAIFGASYGGYAALAGVTFTPELYRCAINYVGVSDLKILMREYHLGSEGTARFYKHWVGTDSDFLDKRSPVNFVDRIRVPTMHIYGFNDPRVDYDHWKRLRAKLIEFNKPFEEVVSKDEGHGFFDEKASIDLYTRIEAFLEANMKPLD